MHSAVGLAGRGKCERKLSWFNGLAVAICLFEGSPVVGILEYEVLPPSSFPAFIDSIGGSCGRGGDSGAGRRTTFCSCGSAFIDDSFGGSLGIDGFEWDGDSVAGGQSTFCSCGWTFIVASFGGSRGVDDLECEAPRSVNVLGVFVDSTVGHICTDSDTCEHETARDSGG